MTDFFTETAAEWGRQDAERACHEAHRAEQQRHAIARLLSSRGQMAEVTIVAMSGWRTEVVDEHWESELCRGVLSVPPEGFDAVDDDVREVIAAAADAVIGEGFIELAVQVRLEDIEPRWDAQLVARLRELATRDTTPTATPVVFELPAGSWDAS